MVSDITISNSVNALPKVSCPFLSFRKSRHGLQHNRQRGTSTNDHAISRKDSESGPESLRAEKKASEDICYEDLVPDGTRN